MNQWTGGQDLNGLFENVAMPLLWQRVVTALCRTCRGPGGHRRESWRSLGAKRVSSSVTSTGRDFPTKPILEAGRLTWENKVPPSFPLSRSAGVCKRNLRAALEKPCQQVPVALEATSITP